MAISFPTATKNARADAICDAVDTGTTNTYGQLWLKNSGGDTLVKLNFSNPAFGGASNGVCISGNIQDGLAILAGSAVSFDVVNRDETVIFSGTVGAVGSGADLESDTSSVTMAIGEQIEVSSLVYTEVS